MKMQMTEDSTRRRGLEGYILWEEEGRKEGMGGGKEGIGGEK